MGYNRIDTQGRENNAPGAGHAAVPRETYTHQGFRAELDGGDLRRFWALKDDLRLRLDVWGA